MIFIQIVGKVLTSLPSFSFTSPEPFNRESTKRFE
jgi:hypothetical protein